MNIYEQKLDLGNFWVQTQKPQDILILNQCHSNVIVPIHKKSANADGFIWNSSEIQNKTIAIYTADCLPILIEGSLGGVFLHAGWRGVQKKIHTHEIIDSIKPKKILIGPSIQVSSFEVTKEFYDYFPVSRNFQTLNKKIYFNLQAQVIEDLQRKWPKASIIDDKIDTFSNLNFHSFRRTGKTDRNYNLYKIY